MDFNEQLSESDPRVHKRIDAMSVKPMPPSEVHWDTAIDKDRLLEFGARCARLECR